MKPSELTQALEACITVKQPACLWGEPGIGKSNVVHQTGERLNLEVRDVRAVLLDPVDLRGLPIVTKEGMAKWAIPDFLPRNGSGILFLDELNRAPALVQNACFVKGTYVSGEKTKPIEQIETGNKVTDHQGNNHVVTVPMSREYTGDTLRIKARHFLPLQVTPEHPFLVIEKYQKGNAKWKKSERISEPKWIEAKNLAVGHYVGTPILQPNRNDTQIIIESFGAVRSMVELTPNLARFIGYYVGDGWASNGRIGISLNIAEVTYIADVKNLIATLFERSPNVRGSYCENTRNVCDVGFGFHQLASWLTDECGANTYQKRIPNCILYHENKEILRQFLIGYFRADGHVFDQPGEKSLIGFTTVSKELALQIQQAFTRFGVLVGLIYNPPKQSIIRGKVCNHVETYRIQSANHLSFKTLGLEKQHPGVRPTKHHFEAHGSLWAKIDSINEILHTGTVYNCEVYKSHTYLANNIAVHNCFQLVLDRKLGEYSLPDDWSVIAACNPSGGGVTRMSDALANRFVHLDVEPDLNDWCRWANQASSNIEPIVIAFLRFKPELLHKFDAKLNQKAFPTPRSWEFVSRITAAHPGNGIELALYEGAVGKGAAIEYAAFLRLYRELPSIDAILLNPAKAPIPEGPATLYAVSSALARRATDQNLARVLTYSARLPKEYEVLIMKDATQRDKSLESTREFTKWATANHEVFS